MCGKTGVVGVGVYGARRCGALFAVVKDEVRSCMGLTGTVRCEDISKQYFVRVDWSGFVSRL